MLCLSDLALNLLRSMISSSWQERAAWATSDFTKNTAEGAKQVSIVLHHPQYTPGDRHVLLLCLLVTDLRLLCADGAQAG